MNRMVIERRLKLEFRVTKRFICSAGSGADWSDAFDLCIQKGRIDHTGEVHLHPQVPVRTGELPPSVPQGPEVADQVVDGVPVEAVGVHGNVVLTGGHHVLDMAIEFARKALLSEDRPSFAEIDEATSNLPASS